MSRLLFILPYNSIKHNHFSKSFDNLINIYFIVIFTPLTTQIFAVCGLSAHPPKQQYMYT